MGRVKQILDKQKNGPRFITCCGVQIFLWSEIRENNKIDLIQTIDTTQVHLAPTHSTGYVALAKEKCCSCCWNSEQTTETEPAEEQGEMATYELLGDIYDLETTA